MNYPSVKTIEKKLGVDRKIAKMIRGLMDGSESPMKYESVKKWRQQCYNSPSYDECVMCALNEILGGFGVEVIDTENSDRPVYVDSFYRYFVAEYVNMGDTYDMTILRNCDSGRFYITTWGDYVESKNLV